MKGYFKLPFQGTFCTEGIRYIYIYSWVDKYKHYPSLRRHRALDEIEIYSCMNAHNPKYWRLLPMSDGQRSSTTSKGHIRSKNGTGGLIMSLDVSFCHFAAPTVDVRQWLNSCLWAGWNFKPLFGSFSIKSISGKKVRYGKNHHYFSYEIFTFLFRRALVGDEGFQEKVVSPPAIKFTFLIAIFLLFQHLGRPLAGSSSSF